jgi:hypothetical protein
MDAHDIVDDIYRHTEKFMHESCMVMQPDYVSKPKDLPQAVLVSLVLDSAVEDVLGVSVSDALLLLMQHQHTGYRDKADPYAGNDRSA